MRVTSLARRLGAAALVLTVLAGLTSCSDDADAGSSSSVTDEGAGSAGDAATPDAAEEAADEDADEDATGSGAPAELSADGFYSAVLSALRDAGTFSFETVSESAGRSQTMTGQARFSADGTQMKASSSGAQPLELILLGDAMYLKSPDLGAGDTWVKVDLTDSDSLFGMIGKATDPTVVFKAMESPEKLELIGSEEVDGVPTNHYRITIDPRQYAEAMDLPDSMAGMLPQELVTDMWVDGDDLPRRFSQTLEVPGAGGGAASTSTTEGTYSDFGTEVEIEAPPADEVTEDFPGA